MNREVVENRKRLNREQKHEIYALYQKGLVSREIAKKIGCSAVTVCHWIHRLIESDGVLSPKYQCVKIRRKPIHPKPHRPHQPQQYKRKYNLTLKEKEKLKCRISDLYQKYESAPKVVEELKKEGIYLSAPTVLKKMREAFNGS